VRIAYLLDALLRVVLVLLILVVVARGVALPEFLDDLFGTGTPSSGIE
jgi:hypothetical protein